MWRNLRRLLLRKELDDFVQQWFSPEQLVKIAGEHDERTYASGEQIIRQGDPGGAFFLPLIEKSW